MKNIIKFYVNLNLLKHLLEIVIGHRFFEAILCLSIPILEDNSKDIFYKIIFIFMIMKNIYSKKSIKQL